MATLPHSGEQIPPEALWLQGLDEVTLMGDVDRYIDKLYEESLKALAIPSIKTEWHRYAADLNRLPSDVDAEAVKESTNPAGTFPRGFHWVYSTKGEKILHHPLEKEVHDQLVKRVHDPFHREVQALAAALRQQGEVYHLDLHSMPSRGTAQHRDPGEYRKEVVISDVKGTSCSSAFKEAVMGAFSQENFSVSYNWPYFGGRLTEQYGRPSQGHHVIQIELNRALYMDEATKRIREDWPTLAQRLGHVLKRIKDAAACEFKRV
jgi:N-formylglutamate amidohydrolase